MEKQAWSHARWYLYHYRSHHQQQDQDQDQDPLHLRTLTMDWCFRHPTDISAWLYLGILCSLIQPISRSLQKANQDLVEEVVRFSQYRYPYPCLEFGSESEINLNSKIRPEADLTMLTAEDVESEKSKRREREELDETAREQWYYQFSSSQIKFVEFMYYHCDKELLGEEYDGSEILKFLGKSGREGQRIK